MPAEIAQGIAPRFQISEAEWAHKQPPRNTPRRGGSSFSAFVESGNKNETIRISALFC